MTGTCPNYTRHYACNWLFSHHTGVEKRTCFEKNMLADAIEADIWREIEELFSDRDRLWNQLKAAQQEELDSPESKREELQAIQANIAQSERNAATLGQTLQALVETIKADPNGVVIQDLRKKVEETNGLYRHQVERRNKLLAELDARVLTDERVTEIMEYARDARGGIQNADFGATRRMLEWLRVEVTIKEANYHLIDDSNKHGTNGAVAVLIEKGRHEARGAHVAFKLIGESIQLLLVMIMTHLSASSLPHVLLRIEFGTGDRIPDDFQTRVGLQDLFNGCPAMPGRSIPKEEDPPVGIRVQHTVQVKRRRRTIQVVGSQDEVVPRLEIQGAVEVGLLATRIDPHRRCLAVRSPGLLGSRLQVHGTLIFAQENRRRGLLGRIHEFFSTRSSKAAISAGRWDLNTFSVR